MTASIQFGSKQIDFHVEYSDRKTLGITVTPDLDVLVKAPVDSSLDKIKEKLHKKAPWIIRQQSFFLPFHPKTTKRKYIGGETHLYLGRQYRLKIEQNKVESVKFKGKFINVMTTDKLRVRQLVNEWYVQHARKKFHTIAQPLIDKFKKHKVEPSSIVLREMPSRWGSCTPKGKIILNPELIKAPVHCIDYVIIHELCHLKVHNHSRAFYELKKKYLPDWEKRRFRLSQY